MNATDVELDQVEPDIDRPDIDGGVLRPPAGGAVG